MRDQFQKPCILFRRKVGGTSFFCILSGGYPQHHLRCRNSDVASTPISIVKRKKEKQFPCKSDKLPVAKVYQEFRTYIVDLRMDHKWLI